MCVGLPSSGKSTFGNNINECPFRPAVKRTCTNEIATVSPWIEHIPRKCPKRQRVKNITISHRAFVTLAFTLFWFLAATAKHLEQPNERLIMKWKKQIDSWKDSNCLLVHELCECACTEFSIAIVMGWIDTERDWVHSIKRFYLIARLSTSCNNCLGMRMHCESHNKYEIV